MIDEDRIKHSLAVARKMVSIANEMGMDEKEKENCFVIGLNHDIGYEFTNKESHGKVGGEILRNSGFEFWKEIYYHGDFNKEFSSKYLTILNKADMQIDKYGNDVGYEKRLEDIKSRYGEDSKDYIECKILIEKLKNS